MPVEVGIWRINGAPERVHFSSIEKESKLEDVLYTDIGILDPSLMVVGRQVPTSFGKFIDLLAIDAQGDLTVVELKRDRTPREVVAQVLDYASWAQDLTYERVTEIYAEHHPGERFEQAFADRFGAVDPPESLNEDHKLVVVASELDNSTERIIGYLSANYGVPINAVFFRHFKEGDNEYLVRSWLIDPDQAEAQSSRAPVSKGGKEAWNGVDFYAAVGEGPHRRWEDCRRYGFVSAGQGRWYSASLHQLAPGARVFACIPKRGYVGVGTVTESAVRVRDFRVLNDSAEIPILDVEDLEAPAMDENADDPELSEYLVRVEGLKTLSAQEAIWEKGMYANQNSATKLRNKFTLDRLAEHFGLSD
jgi:Endonuclease NucS